jgi:hypothetical protein
VVSSINVYGGSKRIPCGKTFELSYEGLEEERISISDRNESLVYGVTWEVEKVSAFGVECEGVCVCSFLQVGK